MAEARFIQTTYKNHKRMSQQFQRLDYYYVCMYVYIYIYIERERERAK